MTHPTLLLVEDSADDIRVTLRFLTRNLPEVTVEVARDGLEAMDALGLSGTPRGHRPDLVLCDLKMPRVAGDELLRRMRADPGLKDTPFLVFSSSRQRSDVELCEASGVTEYASKPVGFDEYERALVGLVRRHLPILEG